MTPHDSIRSKLGSSTCARVRSMQMFQQYHLTNICISTVCMCLCKYVKHIMASMPSIIDPLSMSLEDGNCVQLATSDTDIPQLSPEMLPGFEEGIGEVRVHVVHIDADQSCLLVFPPPILILLEFLECLGWVWVWFWRAMLPAKLCR